MPLKRTRFPLTRAASQSANRDLVLNVVAEPGEVVVALPDTSPCKLKRALVAVAYANAV